MQDDAQTGLWEPSESHVVERTLIACALEALSSLASWHHGSRESDDAEVARLTIGVPTSWCPEGWTPAPGQFDPRSASILAALPETNVSEIPEPSGLTVLILFRSSPTNQEWQDLMSALRAHHLHSLYVAVPRTHPDSGGYEEESLYSSTQIGSPQYTWDFGSVVGLRLLDEPTGHEDPSTGRLDTAKPTWLDSGSASPSTVSGFRVYGWSSFKMSDGQERRIPHPRAWAWLPYGPAEDYFPFPADLLPSLLSLHDRRRRSQNTHVLGVPLAEITGENGTFFVGRASVYSERLGSLARRTFRRLPSGARIRLKRHARRAAEWVVKQDTGLA